MGLTALNARPGGNVTGVDMHSSALDAKRLDILRQVAPEATKFAALVHSPQIFEQERRLVREVATKAGLTLEIVGTTPSSPDYDEAFAAMARSKCEALLVLSTPIFARDRQQIIERAARARLVLQYEPGTHQCTSRRHAAAPML